MPKEKTTALSAKEQLLAEAALTQAGQAKAAASLSRSAIAARQGKDWEPEPVVIPSAEQQAAEEKALREKAGKSIPVTPLPSVVEDTETGVTTSEEADGILKDAAERLGDLGITFEEPPEENELTQAISERREALATEEEATLTGISEMFAQRKAEQEATNRSLLGQTRTFLGRAGAFSSVSGRGAIQKQVMANEQAITELAAQEQSALLAAKKAYADQDFELLSKSIAAADARRAEINQLRQMQLQNTLSVADLIFKERAGEASEFELAQAKLELLSTVSDPSTVSEETLTLFDDELGLGTGFTKSYLDAQQALLAAQTAEDELASTEKLVDILSKVPENESIEIAGQTLTGWKTLEDSSKTSWSTDDAGNVKFLSYNPKTGEQYIVDFGKTGKATRQSGGKTTTTDMNKILAAVTSGLNLGSNIFDQDTREAALGLTQAISSLVPGTDAFDETLGNLATELGEDSSQLWIDANTTNRITTLSATGQDPELDDKFSVWQKASEMNQIYNQIIGESYGPLSAKEVLKSILKEKDIDFEKEGGFLGFGGEISTSDEDYFDASLKVLSAHGFETSDLEISDIDLD